MAASGHMIGWLHDWNLGLCQTWGFPGAAACSVGLSCRDSCSTDGLAKAGGGTWLSSCLFLGQVESSEVRGKEGKLRDPIAQPTSCIDEDAEA